MPDIAGFAGKALGNVQQNLGAIEKAVIEIYDLRPIKDGENTKPIVLKAVEVEGATNGVKMGPGGENGTTVMTHLDQRSVQDILRVAQMGDKSGSMQEAKVGAKMLSGAGGDLQGGAKTLEMQNVTRKTYEVQFNPAMMQLSAHGGGLVRQLNYADPKNGNNGITYGQEETVIILTVPLFFDRCDPQDAFGADKLSSSMTQMAKGLLKAGLTAAGKKEVTVQREVEGFVGMIRNQYTRFVTFYWGDVSYSGIVNNVDVKYTMFNITGQPVRATVNLSIMCLNKKMKGSKLVWRDMYKKAFDKKNDFLSKAEEVGNTAKDWTQSFLNL